MCDNHGLGSREPSAGQSSYATLKEHLLWLCVMGENHPDVATKRWADERAARSIPWVRFLLSLLSF